MGIAIGTAAGGAAFADEHANVAKAAAAIRCMVFMAELHAAGSLPDNDNHSDAQLFPDHSPTRLSRSALSTTVSEDSAMAAPANIGDIRMPATG